MKNWDSFLQDLDLVLGKESVNRWVRTLKILKFDAGNLYLEADDVFHLNWIKEHVFPFLPGSLKLTNGSPIKLHFSISGAALDKNSLPANCKITRTYNFEGLVVGDHNIILNSIFQELIDGTLQLGYYNPIYIYGPKGSGKTHMLVALFNAIDAMPHLKCVYTTATEFVENAIKAFRFSTLTKFRHPYRNADLLIIDDIDAIGNKLSSQEELFNTFNHLHSVGSQIILSSLFPTNNLQNIEKRLISRFEWGLNIPISYPKVGERTRIVKMYASQNCIEINQQVANFIADACYSPHDIKLITELIKQNFCDNAITISDVKKLMHNTKQDQDVLKMSSDRIINMVASSFGISADDILSRNKSPKCSLPRQISMYLCRHKLKLSFTKIGVIFDRDHSTVISNVKKAEEEIKKASPLFAIPVANIERSIMSATKNT